MITGLILETIMFDFNALKIATKLRTKKHQVPRTQITNFLEDLTHKMEGHFPKKEVKWVPGN